MFILTLQLTKIRKYMNIYTYNASVGKDLTRFSAFPISPCIKYYQQKRSNRFDS